jgi:hypothetical protein
MRKTRTTLLLIGLLTLALLTGTTISAVDVNAAPKLKVVIDVSHGQGPATGNWTGHKLQAEMANFEGNLTAKGYQVVWATTIDDSVLADAQFFFLGWLLTCPLVFAIAHVGTLFLILALIDCALVILSTFGVIISIGM